MQVHYSSKTVMWGTPQDLFDRLNSKYRFNTDVCAVPENAKCNHYFTPEIDGLKQKWVGVCWMNPPYGRQIKDWVRKAHQEQQNGCLIVSLLPARTDTKWFHDYIYNKPDVEIEFIKGRLQFTGSVIDNAPFPNMIVVFKPAKI